MTRHGMFQPPAAGPQPPATDPHAPMVIIHADRAASDCAPSLQTRAEAQGSGPAASNALFQAAFTPSPTPAANRNPHSHRLWPAGSCMRGFRTPDGTRNPSRQRSGGFQEPPCESRRLSRLP